MKKYKLLLLFVSVSFMFVFSSCDEDGDVNIFTKQDDVELGQEVNAEIKSNPQEYPIYQGDPSVKSYINSRIFNHILLSPQIESKNIYSYQLEIIDDDNTLNAFALPGGYLYVYTGLLKYLDSEAALAGVLGHEIAHAELRHATERLTANYGVSFLLSLILGENPNEIAEIAANLFVGLAFLANSRADENEADAASFEYLQDTRYYPGGVKFFFEHLKDDGLVSAEKDEIATFLSTHPDPIDRISTINEMLQDAGIEIKNYLSTGDDIYHDEYIANIKSKIN